MKLTGHATLANWTWTVGWLAVPSLLVWVYFTATHPAPDAAPVSPVSRAIASSAEPTAGAATRPNQPESTGSAQPPEQKASPETVEYIRGHPEVTHIIISIQRAQEWDLQRRKVAEFVAKLLEESPAPSTAQRFIALKHYEYFNALNELIHDTENKTVYSGPYCQVAGFASTWLKEMAGKPGQPNDQWNTTSSDGMPSAAAFRRFLANPDAYLQELRDKAQVSENTATATIAGDYYHDGAIAHISRAATLHELTLRLQAAGLPPWEPPPLRLAR